MGQVLLVARPAEPILALHVEGDPAQHAAL
jgi:hypothetical protein